MLNNNIKHHYKTMKEEMRQQQKIQSATTLIELYKKRILSKQFNNVTTYLKAWNKLQQEYFAKVPGTYKYQEWSKFSLETLSHGIRQISLHQKSPQVLKNE